MSFVKKIWKDRISQFPNRRTINDGYVTKQVTVGRDEGAVTEEGTPFDATEMNDLENRIYAAIEAGGGGGGGAGTFDYTELFNKPRINNHELDGNKSLGDLGIASSADELPIESGSSTNTKAYIDNLKVERQYFTGTTSGYGNLALGGEFDSNTKVIISATARNKANTNTVYIADIYQNDVNRFGTTYGLHVRNITDNSAVANTVIEGYIWLVKFEGT